MVREDKGDKPKLSNSSSTVGICGYFIIKRRKE